jgi:hypothetical protein
MPHAPLYQSPQAKRRHLSHRQRLLAAGGVVGVIVTGAILGNGPKLAGKVQAGLGAPTVAASEARLAALAAMHDIPAVGPMIARQVSAPSPPADTLLPTNEPELRSPATLRRPLAPQDPLARDYALSSSRSAVFAGAGADAFANQPATTADDAGSQATGTDDPSAVASADSPAPDASPAVTQPARSVNSYARAPALIASPQIISAQQQTHQNGDADPPGQFQSPPQPQSALSRGNGDDHGDSQTMSAPGLQQPGPLQAENAQVEIPHIALPEAQTAMAQGQGGPAPGAGGGNDGPHIQVSIPGQAGAPGAGNQGNRSPHAGGDSAGPPMPASGGSAGQGSNNQGNGHGR